MAAQYSKASELSRGLIWKESLMEASGRAPGTVRFLASAEPGNSRLGLQRGNFAVECLDDDLLARKTVFLVHLDVLAGPRSDT